MTDSSAAQTLDPYPQTGWVVIVNGSLMMWKSKKRRLVARSSAKGELLAMVNGVYYVEYVRNYLDTVFGNVEVNLYTDAADVVAEIKKDHPRPIEKAALNIIHKLKDTACVVNVLALRDQEQEKKVKVQHIDTKLNVADCLTKPMTTQAIRKFMRV